MSYELTGVLERLADEKTVSDKLIVREFVVKTSREYNGTTFESLVSFQAKNKACANLNGKNVGDKVKVKFDISGREYQGRVFNDLSAFGIYSDDANGTSSAAPQNASVAADDSNDLPF